MTNIIYWYVYYTSEYIYKTTFLQRFEEKKLIKDNPILYRLVLVVVGIWRIIFLFICISRKNLIWKMV